MYFHFLLDFFMLIFGLFPLNFLKLELVYKGDESLILPHKLHHFYSTKPFFVKHVNSTIDLIQGKSHFPFNMNDSNP